MFDFVLLAISVIAGAVAAISGFGIGSLITPVLSLSVGTKLAVALVSIPHLIATAIRFLILRSHLDKKLLVGFGLMSAVGGVSGALLHAAFGTPALTLIFGLILVFSGFMGSTGFSERMKFRGAGAWIAGGVSGILGGMVGNQGGIRAAALLGFQVSKESFVATATAIGLVVDSSRIPVYLWADWGGITDHLNWVTLCTVGVVVGTLLGTKLLKRLNERAFKRIVSGLIFLLGAFMTYRGLFS
ncbi:MAG: sulfite exporter TauE/SafE family protein [Deltaproteobacteria bacterium]|nr:sulfite exporter TauE/SafE family protein [Deltaproteobacteria bacterium]